MEAGEQEQLLPLKVTSLADIKAEGVYQVFIDFQEKLGDLQKNNVDEMKKWILENSPDSLSYDSVAYEINCNSKTRIKNVELYSELAAKIYQERPEFKQFLILHARSRLLRSLYKRGIFSTKEIWAFLARNVRQTGFFLPDVNIPPDEFMSMRWAAKLRGIEGELKANDWELFHDYIQYGYQKGSLRYNLKYDLVDDVMREIDEDPSKLYKHLADSVFGEFDEKADCYIANSDGNLTPLAFACFYGAVKCVKALLPRYEQIEKNVCIMAVRSGSLEIYETLKKEHPEISKLLHQAIFWRRHTLFDKMILDAGITRNPIVYCCSAGDLKLVIFCLENGADINDSTGRDTPLTAACSRNRYYIVKYLLENGADIEKCDQVNESPLMKAVTSNSSELVALLIDNGAEFQSKTTRRNQTLLDICSQSSSYEAALTLLNKGYQVSPTENILNNPFTKNATKLISFLDEHHYDLLKYCSEEQIQNHLFSSIQAHDLVTVKKLIEHGADVNGKYRKKTAILETIKANDIDMMKLLVDNGMDIHLKQGTENPLDLAIKAKADKIVSFLLEQGLNPSYNKNDDGMSHAPKQQSSQHQMPKGASYFQQNQLIQKRRVIEQNDDIVEIPYLTEDEMIQRIEARQVPLSEKDSNQRTLLHLAAIYGYSRLAAVLLSKYLDINAVDINGSTALHLALQSHHEDVALLLIKKRAKVEEKDKKGRTPLHIAASRNLLEAAKALINAGCYLNPSDQNIGTPLTIASSDEMKTLLESHGGV